MLFHSLQCLLVMGYGKGAPASNHGLRVSRLQRRRVLDLRGRAGKARRGCGLNAARLADERSSRREMRVPRGLLEVENGRHAGIASGKEGDPLVAGLAGEDG